MTHKMKNKPLQLSVLDPTTVSRKKEKNKGPFYFRYRIIMYKNIIITFLFNDVAMATACATLSLC